MICVMPAARAPAVAAPCTRAGQPQRPRDALNAMPDRGGWALFGKDGPTARRQPLTPRWRVYPARHDLTPSPRRGVDGGT